MPRLSHPVTLSWSPPAARVILACFGPGAIGDILEAACRPLASVTRVASRSSVVDGAVHAFPALVLLPLLDVDLIPTSPLVGTLRDEHVVVAVCVHATHEARGLAHALQLGAQLLRWTAVDDLTVQLAALLQRSAMSDEERAALDVVLAPVSPPELRTMLAECTERAALRLTVGTLGEQAGVSSRTLTRLTQRLAWPAPAELIAWGRVLRVSVALGTGAPATAALARAGGFASVRDMTLTACQRFGIADDLAGLTPARVGAGLQRRLATAGVARPAPARGTVRRAPERPPADASRA